MEVEFKNDDLDRLEQDPEFTAGFDRAIVKAYRKVMQLIRAARDERDLHQMRGARFKKLQGRRSHQHSLRLNDQMRLIVEIKPSTPKNIIVIISIEDPH